MSKHKHVAQPEEIMESSLKQAVEQRLEIEDMPLETLRDYRLYNEEARKINKRLKLLRYPIKQCPVELHPKQRIKFGNNDKSMNPVAVMLSNHLIHFDEKLVPGQTYDLPECIVHYLAEKGYPVWGWVTLKDGSRETRELTKVPRFSISTVYREE